MKNQNQTKRLARVLVVLLSSIPSISPAAQSSYNTSYANFEEKIKGSIEVGKLADLTVLSRNLLRIPSKDILTTEVVYTIVNGEIVYVRSPRVSKG